ncbi:hypothetical protein FGB62_52g02 [Gracilaria domingensis]|nr:hypothetical protein FGB62_52g02 [Gracilaria domingensis]
MYCKEPTTPEHISPYFRTVFLEAPTCAPRLPQDSVCHQVGTAECEEETFCGFLHDDNSEPYRCYPQASEGSQCALSATAPCQGNLVCQIEPKCRPFTFGLAGDFCQYDSHCQVDQGFFCPLEAFSEPTRCTQRRAAGGECTESSQFECEGFCVSSGSIEYVRPGICQPLQTAGEKCTDHVQCRKSTLLEEHRSANLLCNIPIGHTGVCVLETDLLRELGAACNPANDRCDARRGLSCDRVGRRFRCVQRGIMNASGAYDPFCTPNSDLSSCPPGTECRRGLSPSKQFEGMFTCRKRREIVPLGHTCGDWEFAVCERGAICAEAPGFARRTGGYPSPATRTCMKVVAVGARCADLLRFKCQEGSFCVDGVCQRQETGLAVPERFVSLDEDCSELSCAPGTVCVAEAPGLARRCALPVREAGLLQPCSESALFQLVRLR